MAAPSPTSDGGTRADGGSPDGGTSDGGLDAGWDGGTDGGTDGGAPDAGTDPVYYVDPAGNDSADGRSPATAWKTLGRVNGTPLAPGSSVLLKGGAVWNEVLSPLSSGTAEKPITYGAYGTGRPVLDGDGTSGNAITLQGDSHLVFRGLEVRHFTNRFIVFLSDAHEILFDDVYFHDAAEGLHASPSSPSTHITVVRSTLVDFSGTTGYCHPVSIPANNAYWTLIDTELGDSIMSCAIDLGANSTYIRVYAHDCGLEATNSDRHGLYLSGPSAQVFDSRVSQVSGDCIYLGSQGAVLQNNQLSGCNTAVTFTEYDSGFPSATISLTRNRMWDVESGLWFNASPGQQWVISNNSILGARADGGEQRDRSRLQVGAPVGLREQPHRRTREHALPGRWLV